MWTLTFAAGCGPTVGEDTPELEEVCGSDGPVRLLDVEAPPSAVWGSAVIGDRRIAVWYADASDHETGFTAYVSDACGGNETKLGPREYPLVVDDAAYVCDPLTGEIRALDVNSTEVGEVLGAGYDCNPSLRWKDALFTRNGDLGNWGMLTTSGLTEMPVPLDPSDEVWNTEPIAPYLSRWGTHSSRGEHVTQRIFAVTVGHTYVLYDIESGEVQELPDTYDAVLLGDAQRDALLIEPPGDDGMSPTFTLSGVGAQPEPGPRIEPVVGWVYGAGHWSGLLTDTRLIFGDALGTRPRPEFVSDEPTVLRLGDDRLVQASAERIVAWVASTGDLLLDVPCPGDGCSTPRYHPGSDTLLVSHELDAATGERAVWSLALDRSPPSRWFTVEAHQHWTVLPGDHLRVVRTSNGRASHAVDVIDAESSDIATLVPSADGVAWPPHLPLPRPPVGTNGVLEYYVREGEDAGLWLVGMPRE